MIEPVEITLTTAPPFDITLSADVAPAVDMTPQAVVDITVLDQRLIPIDIALAQRGLTAVLLLVCVDTGS